MFTKLKSYEKLKKLAKDPIDLTDRDIFTLDRIKQMQTSLDLTNLDLSDQNQSSLDLRLLYATERVTKDVIDSLFELSKDTNAISKMNQTPPLHSGWHRNRQR